MRGIIITIIIEQQGTGHRGQESGVRGQESGVRGQIGRRGFTDPSPLAPLPQEERGKRQRPLTPRAIRPLVGPLPGGEGNGKCSLRSRWI